ncbi:MAG TPA: phosphatidylserine decarboxylase [Longimicrobiales bacterium]|nr:phosphatidylserine decarboxylase [Longimicrobiales bacterium]
MSGLAIAPEGYIFLGVLAGGSILLLALGAILGRWWLWAAGWTVAAAALAVTFFFRDPERVGERGPDLYLSPADGKVLAVERVEEPEYIQGPALRVSIYLSLLDVHVQRAPVAGTVEYVEHRPGGFAPASTEVATGNERTTIGIDAVDDRVVVRQMAGLVARRIVTYVNEGDPVDQGARIGLIRFGSRVDAFLPMGTEPVVEPGDRVQAGVTVLARRRGPGAEVSP